jgi:branched-chain amino acid transport system permease protein
MRQRWWQWIILLFIIAFPLTVGKIAPYYNTVLILIGIYVILAVSLDLLMGSAGQISVGHAAFYAIGAYTSGILTTKYGVPPLVALLCSLIASSLVAWGIGYAVLRLKGYYLAMATLGLNAVVVTLITGLGSLTGGANGLLNIPKFSILGFAFSDHLRYYYLVWSMVVLTVICTLALTKRPFGRILVAIHSDEEAAGTLGIDASRYKLHIFVVSSTFAGLAGSLFAHYLGFIAPSDFDIGTSIALIVMISLGGAGTVYGAVLGAVFMKLLPEITFRFKDYELLLSGVILVVILIFLPRGIFGLVHSARNRWGRREPTKLVQS